MPLSILEVKSRKTVFFKMAANGRHHFRFFLSEDLEQSHTGVVKHKMYTDSVSIPPRVNLVRDCRERGSVLSEAYSQDRGFNHPLDYGVFLLL